MTLDKVDTLGLAHISLTVSHLGLSGFCLKRGRPAPRSAWYGLPALSVMTGALWLDFNSAHARLAWPWLYSAGLALTWLTLEWRLGLWERGSHHGPGGEL